MQHGKEIDERQMEALRNLNDKMQNEIANDTEATDNHELDSERLNFSSKSWVTILEGASF